MNIEFHYHVIYLIAISAGFSRKKAITLAYSSQLVDDNTDILIIKNNEGKEYKKYISQTKNILKPENELLRIYPCFHFIPGDPHKKSALRKDGLMHVLNTTPNNSNARDLMEKAVNSKNIYRLGIASHAYADTWAHQNFIGTFSIFNSMNGAVESVSPNIGHSDALHKPDLIGLEWKDNRLIFRNKGINNNDRFIKAVDKIYDYFYSFNSNKIKYGKSRLLSDLNQIFKIGTYRNLFYKRLEQYNKLSNKITEKNIPKYDKYKWFKTSVKLIEGGNIFLPNLSIGEQFYRWKNKNYKNDHYFKFSQAVKKHQNEVLNILDNKYYMGLQINKW